MKRTFAIWAALMSAAMLLAGCQPTPDTPVVVQKDMQQMIEKAAESAAAETPGVSLKERVSAPERLELDTTTGNFTVSAAAPVFVPEADSIPIIRVKKGEFTQEQVTAFWEALVGDNVLWENPTEMTKSEIEAQLVAYRNSIASHENEPGAEEANEQIKEDIEYLERIYPAAPDVIEKKQADSTLKRMENRTWASESVNGWYMGTAGNTEGYAMRFNVQNLLHDDTGELQNTAMMDFGTQDANYNYGQVNTLEVDENTQLDESVKQYIKTTPAEAKAAAEGLLQKTGTAMEVYSMKLINDEETGAYDGKVAPAEHYAYSISCTRVVNGVLPCARIFGNTNVEDEDPDYIKTWAYEEMNFMVNDSGIISMFWRAPLELLETKVENSALMPFSDIQAIFEKMMPIKFEATAKGTDNLTCRIENVHLEMMRVVEQGSIENGLLIPVWNFYGVRSRTNNGETDDTSTYILLCINAVDGSVIDTAKGY